MAVDMTKAAVSRGEIIRKNGKLQKVTKGTGQKDDDVLMATSQDFAVLGNTMDPEVGLRYKDIGEELRKTYDKEYLSKDKIGNKSEELNDQNMNQYVDDLLKRQQLINQFMGKGDQQFQDVDKTVAQQAYGGEVPRYAWGGNQYLGLAEAAAGIGGAGTSAYYGYKNRNPYYAIPGIVSGAALADGVRRMMNAPDDDFYESEDGVRTTPFEYQGRFRKYPMPLTGTWSPKSWAHYVQRMEAQEEAYNANNQFDLTDAPVEAEESGGQVPRYGFGSYAPGLLGLIGGSGLNIGGTSMIVNKPFGKKKDWANYATGLPLNAAGVLLAGAGARSMANAYDRPNNPKRNLLAELEEKRPNIDYDPQFPGVSLDLLEQWRQAARLQHAAGRTAQAKEFASIIDNMYQSQYGRLHNLAEGQSIPSIFEGIFEEPRTNAPSSAYGGEVPRYEEGGAVAAEDQGKDHFDTVIGNILKKELSTENPERQEEVQNYRKELKGLLEKTNDATKDTEQLLKDLQSRDKTAVLTKQEKQLLEHALQSQRSTDLANMLGIGDYHSGMQELSPHLMAAVGNPYSSMAMAAMHQSLPSMEPYAAEAHQNLDNMYRRASHINSPGARAMAMANADMVHGDAMLKAQRELDAMRMQQGEQYGTMMANIGNADAAAMNTANQYNAAEMDSIAQANEMIRKSLATEDYTNRMNRIKGTANTFNTLGSALKEESGQKLINDIKDLYSQYTDKEHMESYKKFADEVSQKGQALLQKVLERAGRKYSDYRARRAEYREEREINNAFS